MFAVLTWQAKRGQALVHPDRRTLVAVAGVAVFTLAAAAAVSITARRQPVPPIEREQRYGVPSPMTR